MLRPKNILRSFICTQQRITIAMKFNPYNINQQLRLTKKKNLNALQNVLPNVLNLMGGHLAILVGYFPILGGQWLPWLVI